MFPASSGKEHAQRYAWEVGPGSNAKLTEKCVDVKSLLARSAQLTLINPLTFIMVPLSIDHRSRFKAMMNSILAMGKKRRLLHLKSASEEDWASFAQVADFDVQKLASILGISTRHCERLVRARFDLQRTNFEASSR